MPDRTCAVEPCERPVKARGWCGTHHERWRRTGMVHLDPARKRAAAWRGDAITYWGAHDRVTAVRGAAKMHACAHCSNVAAEWAYDHADPNEKLGPPSHVGGPPRAYSTDPDRYLPLCRSCHRYFDQQGVAAL